VLTEEVEKRGFAERLEGIRLPLKGLNVIQTIAVKVGEEQH
jgi:hypothetical protein